MIKYKSNGEDIEFLVTVQPGASREEIAGIFNDTLKVKVHSHPFQGKANQSLIDFLSRSFKIPKTGIKIVSGLNNRRKSVRIHGLSELQFEQMLKEIQG